MTSASGSGPSRSWSRKPAAFRTGWFGKAQRSFDALIEMYYNSVGHGSVWLLNVPPTQTGEFSEADAALLERFGAASAAPPLFYRSFIDVYKHER